MREQKKKEEAHPNLYLYGVCLNVKYTNEVRGFSRVGITWWIDAKELFIAISGVH